MLKRGSIRLFSTGLVLSTLIMLFNPIDARTETFTAGNYDELIAVLVEASCNHAHDIIKIADGVDIPNTNPYIEIGFSLTLEAGYFNNFTSRKETNPIPTNGASNLDAVTIPEPMRSTTGPTPPEEVEIIPTKGQFLDSTQGGTEKTLGVPGYLWRHGCGPTAVGMVIGYYDVAGFSDLFDGAADTQTNSVNQGIASERSEEDPGHYEDYSLPDDTGQENPLPDRSENPEGDEHADDSIADFMKTSFSSRGNFYGWSFSSEISSAFLDYIDLRNTNYTATSNEYYMSNGSLTWSVLTTEIDNDRPMIFLVDSDANGETDHFVTVVGYRDDTSQQYGCLDTWSPASTVRWCDFAEMASGQSFGIWGGWSFTIEDTDTLYPERTALIALYNSTDGDNWLYNTNWKTPPLGVDGFALPGTECSWYGVTCSGGDTVTQISLSNQLSGSLPPEIGNLKDLLVLALCSNQLTGSIPPELGELTKLTTLSLCSNQLTGSIPAEIGNLTNLTFLNLGFNQLTGSIPTKIGNLTNLSYLSLGNNQLSGPIPTEIGNLASLLDLDLSDNELTGLIPSSMKQYLPFLMSLDIAGNHLYTNDPDMKDFLYLLQPGWEESQSPPFGKPMPWIPLLLDD